ncbi:probable G-protein coupled receptor No18 [Ptychodera flava]|uniref:probable G-protein coupled receptor No18 n=1 Tax=Ptychodera flava TaxID=63121 RepID=UPI00396A9007
MADNFVANVSNFSSVHENQTTDDVEAAVWDAWELFKASGLVTLVFVTIVANIIVLVALVKDKYLLENVNNYYILNLAVADLFVGLFVFPFMAVYEILGRWPLGVLACDWWTVTDWTCCTASFYNVVAISIDRHWAVTSPIDYHNRRTKRRVIIMIAVSWIVPVVFWVTAVFVARRMSEEMDANDCYYTVSFAFVVITDITLYYIPSIMVIYYYAKVTLVLRKQGRMVRSVTHRNNITLDGVTDLGYNSAQRTHGEPSGSGVAGARKNQHSKQPECFEEVTVNSDTWARGKLINANDNTRRRKEYMSQYQSRLESQKQITRTLGILTVVFLICWLPYIILWPVVAYCPECIPSKLYEASIINYVNSTLNPLLYPFCNKEIRVALKKTLCPTKKPSRVQHVGPMSI